MTAPVEKAYAYATRRRAGARQLLVFEHRDHDAGVQVPGGTVETGETPREAAVRELAEETGLARLTGGEVVQPLGTTRWTPADGERPHRRHFFHVETGEERDRWIHAVAAGEADAGLAFECYWVDLPTAALDHGMGARLDAIR